MIFVLLNIQKNKHLEKKIKNKNYFSKKIENYKTPTKIKYSSGIKKAIKNNWQNNSSELKKLIFFKYYVKIDKENQYTWIKFIFNINKFDD